MKKKKMAEKLQMATKAAITEISNNLNNSRTPYRIVLKFDVPITFRSRKTFFGFLAKSENKMAASGHFVKNDCLQHWKCAFQMSQMWYNCFPRMDTNFLGYFGRWPKQNGRRGGHFGPKMLTHFFFGHNVFHAILSQKKKMCVFDLEKKFGLDLENVSHFFQFFFF